MLLMSGLSLAWWLCAGLAIYGFVLFLAEPILLPVFLLSSIFVPPATMTLFAMSDPRRIVNRPDVAEIWSFFRTSFKRGWLVGLLTVPAMIILTWNIIFFTGATSWLAAFVPLWAIMLIALLIITLYMYSISANLDAGPRDSFRGAMFVLVSRPFSGLVLSLLIFVVGALLSVMVLPMLLFGPAILSSVVNRFVFAGLDIYVVDPNAPTTERDDERARGISYDTSIWDRLRGGGRKKR